MVTDEAIARIVGDNRHDLDTAAKELVKAANRRGGEDNITVVLFDVVDGVDALDGDTAEHPAIRPATEEDDAKTLDEFDAVPAIGDTIVVPPAGRVDEWLEAQQATPRPAGPVDGHREPARPRGSSRRLLLAGGGILVTIGLAAVLVWALSRAHFVGSTDDGRVAVYQGVPWNIVGPVKLYREVYVSDTLHAYQLSPAERRALFDHDLVRRGTALAAVRRYEREVPS
jgi:protein phosphatase